MGNSEIVERVTRELMELIDEGTLPWTAPWVSNGGPRSLLTSRPYAGGNRLILAVRSMRAGYSSPYFATFNQIRAKGGVVKKGERGCRILFFGRVESEREEEEDENQDDQPEQRVRYVLRDYVVFNTDQSTLTAEQIPALPRRENTPIQEAERLFAGYFAATGVQFRVAGDRAFYSPSRDLVQMPPLECFESAEASTSVLAHEVCGHSTGHPTRLNREGIRTRQAFANHEYGIEEIIAETAAKFFMSHISADNAVGMKRSAAYLSHWLAKLKAEPRLLLTAASQAEKALQFFLEKAEEGTALTRPAVPVREPVPAMAEAAA